MSSDRGHVAVAALPCTASLPREPDSSSRFTLATASVQPAR